MEQSSRRAWSKLQEGGKLQEVTERCSGEEEGEEHLHNAQEIPPWHGEAVPARPRRHRARGSRRRYVDEAPSSPSLDLAVDKAQQLESKLEVAMAKVPSFEGEGDVSV
jgi:hypothetical protein